MPRTYIESVHEALAILEQMKEDEQDRRFWKAQIKTWNCKPKDCSDCQHRLTCGSQVQQLKLS